MFGGFMDFLGKIPDYKHDETQQEDQQQFNANSAALSREFNSAEAVANREFQRDMSNTSWRRGTADMMAAGINPMLAFHQGGASTPKGDSGSSSPASSGIASGASGRGTAFTAAHLNEALADKATAEANESRVRARTYGPKIDLDVATAGEIGARTPTHSVSIEKMRQDIKESIERIGKIQQEVKTSASSAAHLDQQVTNLKEAIPHIHASINQLRTLSKLNEAQSVTQLTQQGLNEAHAKEIIQRVRQDLPDLEKRLGELDRIAKQMAQPGHMADEAAKSSLVGQIGAYLNALIPLNGLIGTIPLGRAPKPTQQTPLIHKGTRGNNSIHNR